MPHRNQPRPGVRKGRRWIRAISIDLTTAITVAVTALALYLLYRTLRRYDLDDIVDSVMSVGAASLASAVAWAAASYLCLTFFDWLGLRYAGHPLPYRKAALASFVSLSLGHNIGFAALSSGAVRYRFYSREGLSAEEIARVIVFCGITVLLGLVTLAGIAMLARPGLAAEILRVRRPEVMALAAGSLALPFAYCGLAAFLRRPLRFRGWSMRMPTVGLAAAQVAVGTVNFACVAACLHQAVSAVADVHYLSVTTVYVIANLATIVTHVPGGLGVIESVVLFLLPRNELIGAVLVFRFAYFLLPLAIGLAILAASELRLGSGRAAWSAGDTPKRPAQG